MTCLMMKALLVLSMVLLLINQTCGYQKYNNGYYAGGHQAAYRNYDEYERGLRPAGNGSGLNEWYKSYGPLYLELVIVFDAKMTSNLGGKDKAYVMGHEVAKKLNDYMANKRFTPSLHVFLAGVEAWDRDSPEQHKYETFSNHIKAKYGQPDAALLIDGTPQAEPKNEYSAHECKLCTDHVQIVRWEDYSPLEADHKSLKSIFHAAAYALARLLCIPEDVCGSGGSCSNKDMASAMAPFHSKRNTEFTDGSIMAFRKSFLETERNKPSSVSKCVRNAPSNPSTGHPICGNSVVEKGEACDCPVHDAVCHKCCKKCNLVSGANCYGRCCSDDCKEKFAAGKECRAAIDSCDQPEVCTNAGVCPHDSDVKDGTGCTTADGQKGECRVSTGCVAEKDLPDHDANKDTPVNPPDPENNKSKGGKKWLIPVVIVIVIIALLVAIVAIIFFVRSRKKGPAPEKQRTGSKMSKTGTSKTSGVK